MLPKSGLSTPDPEPLNPAFTVAVVKTSVCFWPVVERTGPHPSRVFRASAVLAQRVNFVLQLGS